MRQRNELGVARPGEVLGIGRGIRHRKQVLQNAVAQNVSAGLLVAALVFDAITTSEEARSCKPHPGIYHDALAKAGDLAAQEVVFVGDSLDYDVAGANALGMTTVLITEPPSQIEGDEDPDYVIEAIPELLQIVSE